jgi:hypothetical protein
MRLESRTRQRLSMLVPLLALTLLAACELEEEELPVPSAAEVQAYYEWEGELSVEISGNVAQVTVVFDPQEYQRGGDLWAKAFPYIFVFSPGTRTALQEHRGLGGVRVIARHPNGDTVAQALLSREALTEVTWQRAVNIAGRARQEGTERPARMQDLVEWGEDYTDFEYNPSYIDNI